VSPHQPTQSRVSQQREFSKNTSKKETPEHPKGNVRAVREKHMNAITLTCLSMDYGGFRASVQAHSLIPHNKRLIAFQAFHQREKAPQSSVRVCSFFFDSRAKIAGHVPLPTKYE
jgi:hypothetical protein